MTPVELSIQEENEKKKEFLRSYCKSLRREERIEEDIQELRMRKMFPGCGAGDGMPHGSDQTDLSDYIVILDQLMEDLKQERLNGAVRRMQIEKSIRALSDENEAEVLRLRYIKNKKWEEIALEMGYSWQHVQRFHSNALKKIKMRVNESK